MQNADNNVLMMRWFDEVWNRRLEETIDELLHHDVIGYHEDREFHGPADFKGFWRATLAAVPDLELSVESTLADGDQVVVEWSIQGTQEGEALGVPPTHKKVEVGGFTWLRIAGGQIVAYRTYWNSSYVLRFQLEQVRAEIRTLKGILPICAHCKRIRSDGGYWEQVESYISKHSLAEFSHGICPTCIKEHFPEFTDVP